MEQFKEITMGHEGRLKIKAGIDRAADAVKPTLGAIGMSAVIEVPGLDPIECDDGVTILKNLHFKDHYENIGLQKLRKAAIRTSEKGGDGTATTTVLTQALVAEAFSEVGQDSSRIREVRERIRDGMEEVLGQLSALKRDITEEDAERIANISTLDKDIAKVIADTVKEVGANGDISVERGEEMGYTKEVVSGAKFDSGLISSYLVNRSEQGECVLENPFIALIDRRVSLGAQVKKIMDEVAKSGNKSILFIADEIDGTALSSLIPSSKTVKAFDPTTNKITQGTYDLALVRNPHKGTMAKDFLADLAALTGATIISEEAGMKLDDCGISYLGQADKVVVSMTKCKIIGGKGNQDAKNERIRALEAEMSQTTSVYGKAILKDRLAQLGGGFGVIRVGAYTDTDYNTKKYKLDNGIAATLAALQEGIVPGGGIALLLASANVKEPMFKKAMMAPFRQMAHNAGIHPEVALSNIMPKPVGEGYDFKAKSIVNMFDAGIIDPLKVVRLAFESACAIAMSVISYETVIVVEEKDVKTQ